MNIADLQIIVNFMNTLSVPDDCMWMNARGFELLKEVFGVKAKTEAHADLAGMKVFVDDSVPDRIVQTGTYELKDGVVAKIVCNEYTI